MKRSSLTHYLVSMLGIMTSLISGTTLATGTNEQNVLEKTPVVSSMIMGANSNLAVLLQYADTNLLFIAYGENGDKGIIEKINAIADQVRPRRFNPLYICRMRNVEGVTNVVYIEGNYPWEWASDLVLRISAIDPKSPEPREFSLGHRRVISRFEINSVSNDLTWQENLELNHESDSYDVLNIYTSFVPSSGEIKTPSRIRLGPHKFGGVCIPELLNGDTDEWKTKNPRHQGDNLSLMHKLKEKTLPTTRSSVHLTPPQSRPFGAIGI